MTHAELVKRAEQWLRSGTIGCRVVVTELMADTYGLEIPDAIGWAAYGRSVLVECKTSRSDFLRDKRKMIRRYPAQALGCWRFYLTTPEIVKETDVLLDGWGVYEVRGERVYHKLGTRFNDSGHKLRTPFVSNLRSEIALLISGYERLAKRIWSPE